MGSLNWLLACVCVLFERREMWCVCVRVCMCVWVAGAKGGGAGEHVRETQLFLGSGSIHGTVRLYECGRGTTWGIGGRESREG